MILAEMTPPAGSDMTRDGMIPSAPTGGCGAGQDGGWRLQTRKASLRFSVTIWPSNRWTMRWLYSA